MTGQQRGWVGYRPDDDGHPTRMVRADLIARMALVTGYAEDRARVWLFLWIYPRPGAPKAEKVVAGRYSTIGAARSRAAGVVTCMLVQAEAIRQVGYEGLGHRR